MTREDVSGKSSQWLKEWWMSNNFLMTKREMIWSQIITYIMVANFVLNCVEYDKDEIRYLPMYLTMEVGYMNSEVEKTNL